MTSSSAAPGDGPASLLALPLLGRRIQIAGSASAKTDPALIKYAHDVVAQLVRNIISAGGGIVLSIGKEPRPESAPPDAPSLIFDWTALEVVADCIAKGHAGWPSTFNLPIVLVSSEKSASEIPDNRRPLYESLLNSGKVRVESIMPGSRAAVFLRQRQAEFGDALVVLGGGSMMEQ
jgi:TIR- and PNP-associating SLOG family